MALVSGRLFLTLAVGAVTPVAGLALALERGDIVVVRQVDADGMPGAIVLPGGTLVGRVALRLGRGSLGCGGVVRGTQFARRLLLLVLEGAAGTELAVFSGMSRLGQVSSLDYVSLTKNWPALHLGMLHWLLRVEPTASVVVPSGQPRHCRCSPRVL